MKPKQSPSEFKNPTANLLEGNKILVKLALEVKDLKTMTDERITLVIIEVKDNIGAPEEKTKIK